MKEFSPLAALKWLAAIAVAQWLLVPNVVRALVVLMAIDYASGFVAAIRSKQVSSEVGWWGLIKKLMTLVLLLSCHLVEQMLGAEWRLEEIGAIGYCVNEVVSIVENSSRIGVPIPAQLVAVLSSVQKLRADRATPEQLRELEKD